MLAMSFNLLLRYFKMSEVGTKPQLGLLFLMQNVSTGVLLELVLANTRSQIAQGGKLLWQWHSAVGYLRCGWWGVLLKAEQGQPEAAISLAFPKALLSWIIQKRDVLKHLPALLRCEP